MPFSLSASKLQVSTGLANYLLLNVKQPECRGILAAAGTALAVCANGAALRGLARINTLSRAVELWTSSTWAILRSLWEGWPCGSGMRAIPVERQDRQRHFDNQPGSDFFFYTLKR